MIAKNTLTALTAALALHTTTAHAVVFTTNTTIGVGIPTYDGQPIVVSNCTLTVDGVHSFASLWLTDSAVLTHSPAPAGETNNRLDLTIAGAMTIDATSRVDVNAKGYGPAAGPGAGTNAGDYPSGGGYGGPGGNAHAGPAGGVSYGDLLAPTVWGSGGGSMDSIRLGGAGGGWVRLRVSGVLTVAGQLTAQGESVWASGGAGGSIHVIAGTLAGSGSITANGGSAGNAWSGGGGAGRIALYYGNSTFSGTLTALGGFASATYYQGNSGNGGGAGTLYTKADSQSFGDLLLDNTGRTNAMETPITSPVAYPLTLTNVTAYATAPLTLTSLRVSTNGLLTHPFQGPRLQVLVQGNAVVEAGGAIAADTRGYPAQTGPGKGSSYWDAGSGAGHGGQGGKAWYVGGGGTYDSETEPVDFGSGGGDIPWAGAPNRGGGAIQLTVAGTLTIDGRVSVNADAVTGSYDGGSAGGSVWLTANQLNGAGSITANGQSASYSGSGGGGGGRIALYYGSSTFSGGAAALGGLSPLASGAAGTLYTKASSQSAGDLLIDNTGRTNAMETLIAAPVAYRLTLTNATAYATNALTLTGLRVSANGLLTHPFRGPRLQVLVQGNAVVEGGGVIGADARGYPAQTGPGKGSTYWDAGSGAGHGGHGGNSWYVGGGGTYGSETEPVDFGSGGGDGRWLNRGGGAMQLTVTGTLTIDGRVSVNADAVTGGYAGGGAGGSVWLSASRLNGAGSITANGQSSGYAGSGGGGGGRIASP